MIEPTGPCIGGVAPGKAPNFSATFAVAVMVTPAKSVVGLPPPPPSYMSSAISITVWSPNAMPFVGRGGPYLNVLTVTKAHTPL